MESKMNIAKNMEYIFLAAVAVISATGFATAATPLKHNAASAMPVVTVTAKRLSAAEKAAL
jgi:hypothetical protein